MTQSLKTKTIANNYLSLTRHFGTDDLSDLLTHVQQRGWMDTCFNTIWRYVAKHGGDKEAEIMLSINPHLNLDICPQLYKTPLHVAAGAGNLRMVRFLIEQKGMDFDLLLEKNHSTPFVEATRNQQIKVMTYLLQKGVDVEKNQDFNAYKTFAYEALHKLREQKMYASNRIKILSRRIDFNKAQKIKEQKVIAQIIEGWDLLQAHGLAFEVDPAQHAHTLGHCAILYKFPQPLIEKLDSIGYLWQWISPSGQTLDEACTTASQKAELTKRFLNHTTSDLENTPRLRPKIRL